jgi:hypothetical protein
MQVFSNKFKRDGQHETPQAPPSGRTQSAPTTRALRLAKRNAAKLLAQAGTVEKFTTATTTSISVSSEKFVLDQQMQIPSDNKSSLSDLPLEQHHRAAPLLDQPASPLDDALSTDFLHRTRNTNVSDLKRVREKPINFPPPTDPIWSKINEELRVALPQVFPSSIIKKMEISKLNRKADRWLHAFFLERFGEIPSKKIKNPHPREKRENKAMARYRMQKNEVRKARKALLKAGFERDSEPLQALTRSWRIIMKRHNKLRKALLLQERARARKREEKRFKKNPPKFAKTMFAGKTSNQQPLFSAEAAKEYFANLYRDTDRKYSYSPLSTSTRPPLPAIPFITRCPTFAEFKASARRKRNGAAASLNALTYVPYKKCPALLAFVHRLGCRIWKELMVPDDWAMALLSLLAKTEDLSLPAEFRPIAVACTVGKIFFSIVSVRMERFMVKNNYIRREVQKGFLAGIPGCLEHSFGLFEALKEAKSEKRQIVISWLDLANAYGSVRHNLIQFALAWFHIPESVQKLIFNYYDKMMGMIKTKNWTTGFFLFDIGLFQGCVLSTILFDCVFQMLLDFLKPLNHLGYTFKRAPVSNLARAYADDLALITKTSAGNQKTIDRTSVWLNWTKTMAAKPRKCISFAMKQFDRRVKNHSFTPATDLCYSMFDPRLQIAGKQMAFLLTPRNGDFFKSSHFKFLGRQIHARLQEKEIANQLRAKFLSQVEMLETCLINGFMKLWIYQHYILAYLSWPFLIYDLNLSFAKSLTTAILPKLKRWSGIGRTVDTGLLFRARKNFGLGLTSVTDHYQRMQIVKCDLLANSVDPNIRALFETRVKREATQTRIWSATKLHSMAVAESDLKQKYPANPGRQGLGLTRNTANLNPSEKRKLVTQLALSFAEEKRIAHAHSLARQGVWLQWQENTTPFDFSWHNLIYGPGRHILKFVLNASVNWVKTPDLLKLWGYSKHSRCPLCQLEPCTLHHIIVGCPIALREKRYTWRHDSVLLCIEEELKAHLQHRKDFRPDDTKIVFVAAGTAKAKKRVYGIPQSIMDGAKDWQLLVDFDSKNIVFPTEIYSTPERPDIIIFSSSLKRVIMIELTCPAEEGIQNAVLRKQARYKDLQTEINNGHWTATLLTVEVGARGFVAHSVFRCLQKLGFSSRSKNRICKKLSLISAKCSYTIYLSTNSNWHKFRTLLTLGATDP